MKFVLLQIVWTQKDRMYTSYSIWLILTSIILLLSMVGAIVITIKQREVKREVNSMNT